MAHDPDASAAPDAAPLSAASPFPAGARTPAEIAAFITANTQALTPPLVPELRLHLASEVVALWHSTEDELARQGLPPPFWAFAWAGGQAIARHVLDNTALVAGRRVLDFACGSGVAGVAAAKAGAAQVTAVDVDPFAAVAARLNGALNGVGLTALEENLVGRDALDVDVILAGDICYEQPLAGQVERWLRRLSGAGVLVLVGDPGRTYMPKTGMEALATYQVETSRELEDCAVRRTGVWRLLPETNTA